jgi:hypothetical protein
MVPWIKNLFGGTCPPGPHGSGGSRSVSWGGGQMASAVARAYRPSGGLGARPQWGPVCNLLSSWGAMAPLAPQIRPCPMVVAPMALDNVDLVG